MGMVPVNVSDLSGPALDWAVAKSVGESGIDFNDGILRVNVDTNSQKKFRPSTDWNQGGPLIGDNNVEFYYHGGFYTAVIDSENQDNCFECGCVIDGGIDGPDHLTAACRAIVAAKLGDTVEVPEELF